MASDNTGHSKLSQETAYSARHWLGQVFIRDWNLKLLAVVITLGLWYGVSGQGQPITRRFHGVQLIVQPPDGMEIANQPGNEVDVTLTGSKSKLAAITPRDLVASVKVAELTKGQHIEQLTGARVSLELPEGVKLEKIDPSTVIIVLERRIDRDVKVETQLGGALPEGYEVTSIRVSPPTVRVSGAESHVEALHGIPTVMIPLDGHTAAFTSFQTALDLPDMKIDLVNSTVDVYLDISEKRIERTIAGIPAEGSAGQAVVPKTAAVILDGPKAKLEKMRGEDLKIVVDTDSGGSGAPRVVFPPGYETGIEVRALNPRKFVIAH